MAVGQAVVSAFNGPADLNSFDLVSHELSKTPGDDQKTEEQQRLEVLYQRIRDWREGKDQTISRRKIFEELQENYPQDWLLLVELYELAKKDNNTELSEAVKSHLETVKQQNPKIGHLVDDGLQLVDQIRVKA